MEQRLHSVEAQLYQRKSESEIIYSCGRLNCRCSSNVNYSHFCHSYSLLLKHLLKSLRDATIWRWRFQRKLHFFQDYNLHWFVSCYEHSGLVRLVKPEQSRPRVNRLRYREPVCWARQLPWAQPCSFPAVQRQFFGNSFPSDPDYFRADSGLRTELLLAFPRRTVLSGIRAEEALVMRSACSPFLIKAILLL